MKTLDYRNYNHLIYLYFKSSDLLVESTINKICADAESDDIDISLVNFIKSQLDHKIIDVNYKYLIAGSVYIINYYQRSEEYLPDTDIITGLKVLVTYFVSIFAIVGIYLYTHYNLRLSFNIPKGVCDLMDLEDIRFNENYQSFLSEMEIYNVINEFYCLEDKKMEIDLSDNYILWLCDMYQQFSNKGEM